MGFGGYGGNCGCGGYGGGYGYGGGGGGGGYAGGTFVLIVVLFILLVIVGASFC
ncbi:YjcZ family sporulation protein [Cytobacillus kochii]|uniref:YjcZ family sporulation protein n=1 Tax=Cytobacillus kochii TaxID=859143 RepID=UPI003CCC3C80